MKYRAWAVRTKSDNKKVIVAESIFPIDLHRLKYMLMKSSIEFDEMTRVSLEVL